MSGLGVVHLVFKVQRVLPVFVVCTHSLIELFTCDLGELYKSVQELYENDIHCTLYYTA